MDHEEAMRWRSAAVYLASRLASLRNMANKPDAPDTYRLSTIQLTLVEDGLAAFTEYTGEVAPTGHVDAVRS